MPTKDKISKSTDDRKFTLLANLMAYQIVKDMTVAEGAPILRRLGFSQTEIATIFNSTPNSISVRLAEAKKKPVKKIK
jgi:hypothetical protein